MGRTRDEGPKNLVKVINQPRFQRVFFTNGSTRLSFLVAVGSRDKIVAGFEARGFTAQKAAQE